MIQIARTGVTVSAEEIARLREEFGQSHCVVLPKFMESSLTEYFLRQLESAKFHTRSDIDADREFAKELAVKGTESVYHYLNFLFNNPKLFQVIEQITNCQPIGNFFGRLYSMLPDSEHYDTWHDDDDDNCLIGIGINLSTEIYTGGLFQIRDKKSQKITHEAAHTELGDAHIFRIASYLEHRVTRVEGRAARTVATGHFRSKPDCLTSLKSFSISGNLQQETNL